MQYLKHDIYSNTYSYTAGQKDNTRNSSKKYDVSEWVSEWKGFNVPSAQNRLYRDKVDASKTR